MFESELEKLTTDIEQILWTSSSSEQSNLENVSVANEKQQTVLEAGRRKRGTKTKGAAEKKREDTQSFTSQNHNIIPSHTPQETGNESLHVSESPMMLNDSSHIASYPRNEASQYCNQTSLRPSGCSFAPETIMPTQDPLFTSQGTVWSTLNVA